MSSSLWLVMPVATGKILLPVLSSPLSAFIFTGCGIVPSVGKPANQICVLAFRQVANGLLPLMLFWNTMPVESGSHAGQPGTPFGSEVVNTRCKLEKPKVEQLGAPAATVGPGSPHAKSITSIVLPKPPPGASVPVQ